MPILKKLLLWGIGAVVLAIVGVLFLIKAKRQMNKIDKSKIDDGKIDKSEKDDGEIDKSKIDDGK